MLTREQVIERLGKPLHQPVSFTYPGSEGAKRGVLKDRAVVWSGEGRAGVKYWDVVDLIEFPGQEQPQWMRIGYYRQIGDQLRWASQTTITEPLETWKRLLVEAAREKEWVRKLVVDAAQELA